MSMTLEQVCARVIALEEKFRAHVRMTQESVLRQLMVRFLYRILKKYEKGFHLKYEFHLHDFLEWLISLEYVNLTYDSQMIFEFVQTHFEIVTRCKTNRELEGLYRFFMEGDVGEIEFSEHRIENFVCPSLVKHFIAPKEMILNTIEMMEPEHEMEMYQVMYDYVYE